MFITSHRAPLSPWNLIALLLAQVIFFYWFTLFCSWDALALSHEPFVCILISSFLVPFFIVLNHFVYIQVWIFWGYELISFRYMPCICLSCKIFPVPLTFFSCDFVGALLGRWLLWTYFIRLAFSFCLVFLFLGCISYVLCFHGWLIHASYSLMLSHREDVLWWVG